MTSMTEERRAVSSGPRGTSKGICFSARMRLARTMRWAMVGSGVRKARAISGVVRPPRSRRVRAARDSVERMGWQEMKVRRRRSSPMGSSRLELRSGTVCSSVARSRARSWCLRWATALRRKRSMTRRLAVAVSQAPGFSGTPDCGHCSRAARRASWARSSARAMSRTRRVRPAIRRGDSILQTASMVRCRSVADTATDHTSFKRGVQERLFVGGLIRQLSPFRYFVLDLLFGQDGGEVFHLKDLADFDFGVAGVGVGAAFDPLDGLFEGLDLPEPEAGDELLGLGEGAVDDGTRLAGELDACAFGAGMEAIHGEHDASLHELFVVLAHLEQELWIGEGAFFFGFCGGFDDDHESHFLCPFGLEVRWRQYAAVILPAA